MISEFLTNFYNRFENNETNDNLSNSVYRDSDGYNKIRNNFITPYMILLAFILHLVSGVYIAYRIYLKKNVIEIKVNILEIKQVKPNLFNVLLEYNLDGKVKQILVEENHFGVIEELEKVKQYNVPTEAFTINNNLETFYFKKDLYSNSEYIIFIFFLFMFLVTYFINRLVLPQKLVIYALINGIFILVILGFN